MPTRPRVSSKALQVQREPVIKVDRAADYPVARYDYIEIGVGMGPDGIFFKIERYAARNHERLLETVPRNGNWKDSVKAKVSGALVGWFNSLEHRIRASDQRVTHMVFYSLAPGWTFINPGLVTKNPAEENRFQGTQVINGKVDTRFIPSNGVSGEWIYFNLFMQAQNTVNGMALGTVTIVVDPIVESGDIW